MVVFDKSRESQKMKKNGRHGDNSCLPLYKLTQRYALRRGQRFDHIRHSGADIGIHEEGGVLFRAFSALGSFRPDTASPASSVNSSCQSESASEVATRCSF